MKLKLQAWYLVLSITEGEAGEAEAWGPGIDLFSRSWRETLAYDADLGLENM